MAEIIRLLLYLVIIVSSIIGSCNCDCLDSYYYGDYDFCDDYALSVGAIIGIIIGSLVGIAVLVGLVALCVIIGCNKTRGRSGVIIAPTGTTTTPPTVTYIANPNPSVPVVSPYTSSYYTASQPISPAVTVNFHGGPYPTAPPLPYR